MPLLSRTFALSTRVKARHRFRQEAPKMAPPLEPLKMRESDSHPYYCACSYVDFPEVLGREALLALRFGALAG
jgi:hypothetical protein